MARSGILVRPRSPIYRQFGDMRGLPDEVATRGLTTYPNDTSDLKPGDDPVEDLRAG